MTPIRAKAIYPKSVIRISRLYKAVRNPSEFPKWKGKIWVYESRAGNVDEPIDEKISSFTQG